MSMTEQERIELHENRRAVQPCGHPVSFLLHSAETGEPLYCEACDDKSGRRDAEARETELQAANAALRAEVERLRETKDGAYLERNRCVALIARMALTLGLRAGLARTAIEGWSEDWHGCVYIDLPTGQCSWHFHDSQAHLFYGLPTYAGKWDGHTTPEKYGRVDAAMR
jgi:hypothetical protein